MILAAHVVDSQGAPDQLSIGENMVKILDVHPNTTTQPRTDCDKLSLWVRINGPEIISGKPHAIPSSNGGSCHWQLNFTLAVPGSYSVDAKLLMWNGNAPVKHYKCNHTDQISAVL